MCGINGFNWKDEALINRMNIATAHRGPDGVGAWCDEGISLGHNRLAIIDLDLRATQPMRSVDGRYVIIFNGEIYNYRELKKELTDYPYKTQSDTEVILAAYEKWGKDCFGRLNGMFALALYDTKENTLILVRDPMGIKPLYYHEKNGKYIFSSEIKAILEHPVVRELNHNALGAYFHVLYVPGPETLYNDIHTLLPGTILELYSGKKNIVHFQYKEAVKKSSDAVSDTRNAVEEAVKRQLVSDRPVGIFLSGGIDSSIITDCAVRVQEKINTFSVGFELPDKTLEKKFNHDFLLARKTAKHYDTTHHELMMDYRKLPKLIEDIVYYQDHPIANATMIPTMLLSAMAKEHVAVVLTGDGGDELFGGYDRYRYAKVAEMYQGLPASLRSLFAHVHPALSALNIPAGIDLFTRFAYQKEETLKTLFSGTIPSSPRETFLHYFSQGGNFLEQFLRADRSTWLVDEALMRIDHMTMSAGLEARVPLLDLDLVALADTFSPNQKIGIFQSKKILKRAFQKRLPKHLFNQPKRGWFTPAAKWLREPSMRAFTKEVLSAGYYEPTRALFHWRGIEKLLDEHVSTKTYNLNLVWALLVFQLWAKRFGVKVS